MQKRANGGNQVGTVDSGRGQVIYPAGSGAAAAAFTGSAGLNIAGATTSCIGVPGAASLGACNTALSAAALDNLGTTSGCLYQPGAGGFCNTGL
jgi:hypothetical protein